MVSQSPGDGPRRTRGPQTRGHDPSVAHGKRECSLTRRKGATASGLEVLHATSGVGEKLKKGKIRRRKGKIDNQGWAPIIDSVPGGSEKEKRKEKNLDSNKIYKRKNVVLNIRLNPRGAPTTVVDEKVRGIKPIA